jgi:Mn-dependent DtxR family transcriptional regulator
MDEMNHKHYFSPVGVAKMKRHLEGKGYATDTKYGETKLEYQGLPTVITTN